MKEIWKDIEGYEGLYQISNLGNVKVLDRIVNSAIKNNKIVKRVGKMLKQYNKQGYMQVTLTNNNVRKYFKVHRLVALTFIPNPNNFPQVNHRDENPLNNCVDNLEWCTAKYNCNYGTRNTCIHKNTRAARIKVSQYDLKGNLIKTYNSISEASKIRGVSFNTIRRYCSNITNDKCYIWRYADK
jgi:hypothetical protein